MSFQPTDHVYIQHHSIDLQSSSVNWPILPHSGLSEGSPWPSSKEGRSLLHRWGVGVCRLHSQHEFLHLRLQGHPAEQPEGREALLQDRVLWSKGVRVEKGIKHKWLLGKKEEYLRNITWGQWSELGLGVLQQDPFWVSMTSTAKLFESRRINLTTTLLDHLACLVHGWEEFKQQWSILNERWVRSTSVNWWFVLWF